MSGCFVVSDIELLEKKFHGIPIDNKVTIAPIIRSHFRNKVDTLIKEAIHEIMQEEYEIQLETGLGIPTIQLKVKIVNRLNEFVEPYNIQLIRDEELEE